MSQKVLAVIWTEREDSEHGLGDVFMEMEDGTRTSLSAVPSLNRCSEWQFDKFVQHILIPESHARHFTVPDIKKERKRADNATTDPQGS